MTSTLLTLPGPPALSRFRLKKVLAELRTQTPGVAGVYAEYLHILELGDALTPEAQARSESLLRYGPRTDLPEPIGAPFCVVLPRPGTISPWSSKATDIFDICDLKAVRRVERGVRWLIEGEADPALSVLLHDRMTQVAVFDEDFQSMFDAHDPRSFQTIAVMDGGRRALAVANVELGLALNDDEIDYLDAAYRDLGRDPSDVELMMFAQANSEHCRHKIFNADWTVDGESVSRSLFAMIRNTHARINGAGILSAYADNAAVIEGYQGERFAPDPGDHVYGFEREPVHVLMKVETHNHPTAIAPYPGAATGSGGEIRDEGAVGRGSKPKAGLAGFTTSHLELPDDPQPWELGLGTPERLASPMDIMLEGPIGAAGFNNEFGRPAISGYFRTFEHRPDPDDPRTVRGYHKPIMVAGGVGTVRAMHVEAIPFVDDTRLVVLGGPAMLIGLGGGAASSMTSGQSSSDLDFASVQRDNAEMQRRCQEVIDACTALGEDNPIRLIHDVGAGGLSNALPELVKDAGTGGRFELRSVPNAEPGMAPAEIWCNEAQERYVMAVARDDLAVFERICQRERCPYAVVGRSTPQAHLEVHDNLFDNAPVDVPMSVIFGKPPKMSRAFSTDTYPVVPLVLGGVEVDDALARVLRFPAVGSKQFLITIGDRSITGLVARDQMVGPWQVPVADAAITIAGYRTYAGEAMTMGERPPVALLNPAASARLAVGEALTNLASVRVEDLSRVVLSANWMAAAGRGQEDQALFEAVHAVGMELCPALGIAIPVGKDSLSMHSAWSGEAGYCSVTSPVTLNVSAFAPVPDVRDAVTPVLRGDVESRLLWVDLGAGRFRLGGSALAQCYGQLGDEPADLDDPQRLKAFFAAIQKLVGQGRVLAYHDVSDGGVITTLLEMAFAGHCGLRVDLASLGIEDNRCLAALFAEELGAVVQVAKADLPAVEGVFASHGLGAWCTDLGSTAGDDNVVITNGETRLVAASRAALQQRWAQTSYHMQRLRDNPQAADQEFEAIAARDDPGMTVNLGFDPAEDVCAPFVNRGMRPKVAVLREQGVNGHLEMAAAFDRAGFQPVDVHMTDLLGERVALEDVQVMVACGGFSYGDVLGGGGGWAKSVLFHDRLRESFATFFARDTLTLGVCNGCQMLSNLKRIVPGGEHWPRFVRNASEQFEARVALVQVSGTTSPWLAGMAGSVLPIAVAHGEGRVEFDDPGALAALKSQGAVALQYVDTGHEITERYPANPNGAREGIAAVVGAQGNVLIMMPHPERVYRTVQNSWHPQDWGEDGPWLRLFRNARVALD